MLRNKKIHFIEFVLTLLIVIASVTSVVLAAFTANRSGTSELSFRSGITITVTGVTKSGNNYYWNYKTDPSASSYTNGTATINAVDYLEFAPLTITVTAGTNCYVRVFACVGTDMPTSAKTIGAFSTTNLTGSAANNTPRTATLTTKENNFVFNAISSNSNKQQAKLATTCQVTTLNSALTMCNAYIPYTVRGTTDYPNANFVNKKFYAYVSFEAATDTNWDTNFNITPPV